METNEQTQMNALKEQNELLIELAKNQHETLKLLNKIAFETTKYQRSLSTEERNSELMDLAWSTNDIVVDQPRNEEIIKKLKEQGVRIHAEK